MVRVRGRSSKQQEGGRGRDGWSPRPQPSRPLSRGPALRHGHRPRVNAPVPPAVHRWGGGRRPASRVELDDAASQEVQKGKECGARVSGVAQAAVRVGVGPRHDTGAAGPGAPLPCGAHVPPRAGRRGPPSGFTGCSRVTSERGMFSSRRLMWFLYPCSLYV